MYQRIEVASGDPVGEPGPLPAELQGLSGDSLADLSWVDPARGFAGHGFVWVDDPEPEPAPPALRISKIAFSRLFTVTELVRQAALRKEIGALTPADYGNPDNADLIGMEIAFQRLDLLAEFVELDNADTVAAVTLMDGMDLLDGPTRAARILSGLPPE